MIRAVTFDLWGTLILNSKEYANSLRRMREELLYETLKGTISRESLVNALDQSWAEIQIVRSTLRDVPTSEQIRILAGLLRTDSDLEKPYTEAVLHFSPAINPYAKEVLELLHRKVGLISNTGRTPGNVLRSVLSHLGVLEFFTVTLFSNEVGYLKPHPEIFRKASQKLKIPLSQILHVGDDVKADVEGARNAGMKALLIEEPSDLLKVTELVT
jgi:putative hydrolase of the HAD superfamily